MRIQGKTFLCLAMALLLISAASPTIVAAQIPETAAAPDSAPAEAPVIPYTTERDQTRAVLADGNRYSRLPFPAGTRIVLEAEAGFSAAYLIWDRTPDAWQAEADGNTLKYGADDSFIHHLIEFEQPVSFLVLEAVTGENGVLCDVYLFGEGAVPDWVQRWQPCCERADLLAFPTHADDEFLFFGGTLPTYAGERGLRVQVVYLTNHYREVYRLHELLNGLWTAGIRNYPVMGPFTDYYSGSLEYAKLLYPEEDVLGFQTEMLRRFKPYVVVGHDLNGEYGHGVHRYNSYGLLTVAPRLSDPDFYPESAQLYGTWELPKLYLHLYEENSVKMNWDQPLEAFGGRTGFETAGEAFACHESQQFFQMRRTGVYDTTCFGLAYTSVGPDVEKNDFFENIVFESDIHEPDPISPLSPAPSTQLLDSPAPVSAVPNCGMPAESMIWIAVSVVCMAGISAVLIRLLRKRKNR